ncbi:hypothetical protein [Paenibacillus sp. TH7-28]
MKTHKSIHPFPARMAPEIAFHTLSNFKAPSTVLDPMVGSGTVLRIANSLGHHTIGFDMDPLAVLMSKVWVTPIQIEELLNETEQVVKEAKLLSMDDINLNWIDSDTETSEFINFWFGSKQIDDLRRISYLLHKRNDSLGDALKIALSRIIITKENGATLARDVSHSRPHRVKTESDYDVITGFINSVKKLSKSILSSETNNQIQSVVVSRTDARQLPLENNSVDYVLTSPPYLNAIDYLRGHKLALVWLGYKISELRSIRSSLVGAEKKLSLTEYKHIDELLTQVTDFDAISNRMKGIMRRYVFDMRSIIAETARVLHNNSLATFIVGNCNVKGSFFNTARLIELISEENNFRLVENIERPLNPSRRYLPPPRNQLGSLNKRMSSESIITITK